MFAQFRAALCISCALTRVRLCLDFFQSLKTKKCHSMSQPQFLWDLRGRLCKLRWLKRLLCFHQTLGSKSSIWSDFSSPAAPSIGRAAFFRWYSPRIAGWSDLRSFLQLFQRLFGFWDALGSVWTASDQPVGFGHSGTCTGGCSASHGVWPIRCYSFMAFGGRDWEQQVGDRDHGIILPRRSFCWCHLSRHCQDQALHGNGWLCDAGSLWRYLRVTLWHAQSAARTYCWILQLLFSLSFFLLFFLFLFRGW